jgi:hypothetical protein
VIRRGVAGALLVLSPIAIAAQSQDTEQPRDAAQAVQEGDVAQWLKYYQRERGMQVPAPAPESAPPPADAQGRGEPNPER